MRTRLSLITVSLAGVLAGLGCALAQSDVPAAQSVEQENEYTATIDKLLPGMGAAEIPARQDAQLELEKLCHDVAAPGYEEQRAALARAMMAKAGPGTAKPARVWMLRKIETVGRDEVVPSLVVFMKESDPEIRDPARRALANNPSPKAAAALRAALAETNETDLQVALINALAWRHDAESVRPIAKLAASRDEPVARAATAALGDFSDSAAVKALANLRKSTNSDMRLAAVDASLRAADNLRKAGKAGAAEAIYEELLAASELEPVRIAAITGLARAGGADAVPALVRYVNGDDGRIQLVAARCLQEMEKQAGPAIAKAMQEARPQGKALLLEVLGRRGDPAALKAVAKEATASDAQVRLAALQALGRLGDSSVLELVIERGVKSDGAERDAARNAMASLHGKDVDGMILERLRQPASADQVELLYAVWGRRIAVAKPIVLSSAREGDEAVRVAALTALERIAQTEDLGALAELLVGADTDATRKLAEAAITSTCRRAGDDDRCTQVLAAAMEKAPPAGKVAVIRMLTQLQSDSGLPVIRAAAKSDDASVSEAGLAALKQWKPMRINTWVFSGPYRQEGKGPQDLMDVSFAPEASPGSAAWKPLRLNRREAQSGPVDLKRVAQGDNCCAYARVLIRSDSDREVMLTFGSDDGLKAWLDGEVILTKNVIRSLNCDEDAVKAPLKAGDNTLLVKVTQGGGDWSFCCRIGAVDGGPPDGVSFEAK